SSSTRNMALGRASRIVPSRTIASSLGLGSGDLLVERMGCRPWNAPEGAPPSGPGSHGNACTRALQVRDLADPAADVVEHVARPRATPQSAPARTRTSPVSSVTSLGRSGRASSRLTDRSSGPATLVAGEATALAGSHRS